MKSITLIKTISACSAAFLAFSFPATAQSPDLALLSGLQKGEWTLKQRGSDTSRKVCLGNPEKLLQVQHSKTACSRYVIQDTPKSLRVSYKCGSADHGVTTIKGESSRLIQLQTQGIKDNAPFSLNFEGRRTGSC